MYFFSSRSSLKSNAFICLRMVLSIIISYVNKFVVVCQWGGFSVVGVANVLLKEML